MRLPLFGAVTFGSVIAALCSWSANHSIIWAVIHAFLSWVYVLYWLVLK